MARAADPPYGRSQLRPITARVSKIEAEFAQLGCLQLSTLLHAASLSRQVCANTRLRQPLCETNPATLLCMIGIEPIGSHNGAALPCMHAQRAHTNTHAHACARCAHDRNGLSRWCPKGTVCSLPRPRRGMGMSRVDGRVALWLSYCARFLLYVVCCDFYALMTQKLPRSAGYVPSSSKIMLPMSAHEHLYTSNAFQRAPTLCNAVPRGWGAAGRWADRVAVTHERATRPKLAAPRHAASFR
jgi:hypothetical protein